jgi:glycerol-3-phosphate dehydrogenase (NAD(P)+)
LSSVEFDTKKLKLTSDINEAVAYADYIFCHSFCFCGTELAKLTVSLRQSYFSQPLKGVPETSLIVGDIFISIFHNIGVITGPCHAEIS